MIPKNIYSRSSWFSIRSALFADNATKSPVQYLIHNALDTTRQFMRGIFKNKPKLPPEICRKQHKLPVEFFKDHCPKAVSPKFKFIAYCPGFIQKVTSRWCYESLTNSLKTELLRKFYRGRSGPLIGFIGFALAKKSSLLTEDEELEGVAYLIRDSFSSVPWKGQELNIDKNHHLSYVTLADLKIGKLIAKGCNAAIYSASLCENTNDLESVPEEKRSTTIFTESNENLFNSELFTSSFEQFQKSKPYCKKTELKDGKNKTDDFFHSQFFIPHTEKEQITDINNSTCEKDSNNEIAAFNHFNIAVKVMFNYSAESNAFAIWNSMYKETLPVFGEFTLVDVQKRKARKKLKPHPNIVEMYSAFADQLPLLPGAIKSYPQALPSRLQPDGCGRNMTLFIVMKRYHCSLKEYLQSEKVLPETALLLFSQLLEALVHLFQNGITHRDLKSDNILLDLSEGISSPKLAITDFGCCLENLYLAYTSYDIAKGGNMMLMAPEVVNAEPGTLSFIDYSRSDLWTAGAIAYEIFGATNPFYLNLKNYSYTEKELPPFPLNTHTALRKLVKEMLHVNPKQRPSQNFAATVCQILLHAPPNLLAGRFDSTTHKRALKWMFELSSQTYLEASLMTAENMPVKLELCRTFCCRIQYLELIQALHYILEL